MARKILRPSPGTHGDFLNDSNANFTELYARVLPTGLERITEGGNTGLAVVDRTSDNYGDIGDGAVDESTSISSSSTKGATGQYSHAKGVSTTASGAASTASGSGSIASGVVATAEGGSEAIGDYSHSEGDEVVVHSDYGHGEGHNTIVHGEAAHGEGDGCQAIGDGSHAEGQGTIALNTGSHAAGNFNVGTSTETIHETGIGTSPIDRKNAFEIYADGRIGTPNLPTTDPVQAGIWWNDSGTLKISAG